MPELTDQEKYSNYVRQFGRLSDDHIADVTRVIADPTASIELRRVLWSTTRDAFAAMGKTWSVAEPTEAKS
jgi:hypothetical protein